VQWRYHRKKLKMRAEIQIKIIRLSVLINATINFVEIYWILYMAIWGHAERAK
jgi:hypothetical protein